MFLHHIFTAVNLQDPPDLSWLGPACLAIGSVIVAIIGIVNLIIGKRQDRKNRGLEQKAEADIAIQPKVTDGWEEVRLARAEASAYYNLYRTFENLFYMAFGALRHLARSTRDAHPETVFEPDIVDALAIVPPDTSDAKK